MKTMLENLIANSEVIFECKHLENLNDEDMNFLNHFHMSEIHHIKRDDDYFCGIRANNFCVELGFNEVMKESGCIVVTANHKAIRSVSMYTFKTMEDK